MRFDSGLFGSVAIRILNVKNGDDDDGRTGATKEPPVTTSILCQQKARAVAVLTAEPDGHGTLRGLGTILPKRDVWCGVVFLPLMHPPQILPFEKYCNSPKLWAVGRRGCCAV